MCLGIPGKILEKFDENGFSMAKVDFNGVVIKVCIDTTPDANIGDYIIVHAGFAINRLEEKEAIETLSLLDDIQRLGNSA
jgi:hydrogenase expression/formation protein HypC